MLGIFVALAACTILQAANLMFLNKLQERKRVANGKPKKIKDLSMQSYYQDSEEQPMHEKIEEGVSEGEPPITPAQHTRVGDQAFLDLTDRKNDEFVYVY